MAEGIHDVGYTGGGKMREVAGTQLETTYIGQIQGAVAQWVVLQPIFRLCAREVGYEGGRRRRDKINLIMSNSSSFIGCSKK